MRDIHPRELSDLGLTAAVVELRYDHPGLQLCVVDAGSGGADTGGGTGVAGVLERVRSVGGKLEVTNPPGESTVVAATVPSQPL